VLLGERNFLTVVRRPVGRGFYRLAGVDSAREQDWFAYTIAMVVFAVAGFLSRFALRRLQNLLPLNPRGFDAVPPDLAFNTSISFITNTNWQNYSGEAMMSHLTQMLGLTVHNFCRRRRVVGAGLCGFLVVAIIAVFVAERGAFATSPSTADAASLRYNPSRNRGPSPDARGSA
jgi:K+-transporting ATPase A subunit